MESTLIVTMPQKLARRGEFVMVAKKEYERMKEQVRVTARFRPGVTFRGYETVSWRGRKHKVPAYQLHGKAAERLDKEVGLGLKEYRAGKMITADSMREALEKYARRKKSRN